MCYWQEGVVLVDTPGIGGGNNVDQRLGQYLHAAFGFLYVINTNTAGGVQSSRVGRCFVYCLVILMYLRKIQHRLLKYTSATRSARVVVSVW